MAHRRPPRQPEQGDHRRRVIRAALGLLLALILAAAVLINRTPGLGPGADGGTTTPQQEQHEPDRPRAADDQGDPASREARASEPTVILLDPDAPGPLKDPVPHNADGWERAPQPALDTVTVTIGGEPFSLEMAVEPHEQHRGLSNRRSVPRDGGMIFVFPYDDHLSFVMRRCLVPLDLIYLDARGRITTLHRMDVEPYDVPDDELTQYASRGPARFAIELRAGTIDRLGLERGQFVEMPVERLKAKAW